MTITIRPANADELGAVAQIERDADELFRTIGLDAIPDGAPTPPNAYAPSQAAGRLLVAVTEAGRVAGFVRIELVDGLPHLEQVSVRPADARRGLGRSLMTAAEDWDLDDRIRAHGVRVIVAARIPDGGHMINIDAEAQIAGRFHIAHTVSPSVMPSPFTPAGLAAAASARALALS